MPALNKRLTIMSEEERFALYGIPDFSESQQYEYLTLTNREQEVMLSRSVLSEKIYFAIQIGYFKAKHMFFDLDWNNIPEEGFAKHARHQQGQSATIGKLLQLYVDKNVSDSTTFGEIRQKHVFPLMPEETLRNTAHQMIQKPITELTLKWKAIDTIY